jgi:methyl-accepting chemotaxis protein
MPSYQIRLVLFMCLVLFVGFLLHGFLFYYLIERNMQSSALGSGIDLKAVWELFKPAIIVTNGVSLIVMSFLVFMVAILISHKLAGPMLKISGYLKRLANGELSSPSLRLREKDEGQVLCDAANEVGQSFKEKFVELRVVRDSLKEEDPLRARLDNVLAGVSLEQKK